MGTVPTTMYLYESYMLGFNIYIWYKLVLVRGLDLVRGLEIVRGLNNVRSLIIMGSHYL